MKFRITSKRKRPAPNYDIVNTIASKYYSKLMSHAFRLTRNSDDAKDLFQDTMENIIKYSHQYNELTECDVETFAIQKLKNTFYNNVVARRAIKRTQTAEFIYLSQGSYRNTGLDRDVLDETMRQLTPDEKELLMALIDGYSMSDLSKGGVLKKGGHSKGTLSVKRKVIWKKIEKSVTA